MLKYSVYMAHSQLRVLLCRVTPSPRRSGPVASLNVRSFVVGQSPRVSGRWAYCGYYNRSLTPSPRLGRRIVSPFIASSRIGPGRVGSEHCSPFTSRLSVPLTAQLLDGSGWPS